MCYYNGVKVTKSEYIRLKQLEKAIAGLQLMDSALFTGFDYSSHPVLKKSATGTDFDIVPMEWGFIPFYVKTREDVMKMRFGYKNAKGQFRPPITTLNAVSEELLLPGKIYREAALHRRCLIPSTGFYEWRHIHRLNKRTGEPLKTADKYPYCISVKDREYFFMAGIWQGWTDKATGEHVETFAVVTTAANALMDQIHNSKKRMPAILTEELAWEWLFGDLTEERITEIARFRIPAEQMQAYTIAKDFRESGEPGKPFVYEELPALEAV